MGREVRFGISSNLQKTNSNILQDVKGIGQATKGWREHSGAFTGSSNKVQINYCEMASGANQSRLASMTYASGYVVLYNYGSGLDNTISRLTSFGDPKSQQRPLKTLVDGCQVPI